MMNVTINILHWMNVTINKLKSFKKDNNYYNKCKVILL